MDDVLDQPSGPRATLPRAASDHGRSIRIDAEGRAREVWDPQVVAEFEALGEVRLAAEAQREFRELRRA